MHIKSFVFNPFYENTYLLWDDSKEGVIIDPGCYESYEREELIQGVESEGVKIVAIVNTHCHIDHVLGNYFMKSHFNCPLWIPEGEQEIYRAVTVYAPQWGIQNYSPAEVDTLLEATGEIKFGNTVLKNIFAPGHSPGHLVFYHENDGTLIGGDVLFKDSIGRSDLPGGNHQTLIQSIREKLYTLPDDTEVYPGHGPKTTIGYEKKNNPFVKGI